MIVGWEGSMSRVDGRGGYTELCRAGRPGGFREACGTWEERRLRHVS